MIMSPKVLGRRFRSNHLALLLAIVTWGCEADFPVDLVLANGTVVTLDSTATTAGAVAIAGGRVVAVAASIEPRWLVTKPRIIGLDGAVVMPALVDHHVHLFNVGMALLNRRDGGRLAIELGGVGSLAEVAALVRAKAAATPAGTWILGAGWSQASWGTQDLPTNEVLTRAAPRHPVFLARTDGHAGWVNQAALTLAGIGRTTPNPEGGSIVRRSNDEPSGVLLERANELIIGRLPHPSDADVVAAFRLATEALAARGVVEVNDAGPLVFPGVVDLTLNFGRYLELLRRTDSIAPVPLRINLMVPAPSRLADSLLADSGPPAAVSPRIRITHLKLFADGALGSRGAALTHPYADDPATRGVARMTVDAIAGLTRRGLDHGLGIATHAIGDEAVSRTLEAYERVLGERPNLAPGHLRIEHFSYARDADFARAARLGIVLSIQSNFNALPADRPTFGAIRLGAANEDRVYAWDRLYRLGLRLAEGSDYFALPAEPLAGFAATLGRRFAVGYSRPDSEARLLAYRMNSTWVGVDGNARAGAIRVGGPADLVVLSGNPLTLPKSELAAVRVIATIGEGRVTYSSSREMAPP